ncbi:MAG: DnaJ subfamily er 3 [Acidobacteriota bacterium]|nr:DnaJ subfamily er 3 [Acidobacteriota bacterium]
MESKVWTSCHARFTIWRLLRRWPNGLAELMKDSRPEKDYYAILGAGEELPREEIERCYKRLAQRHHPDRGGDEDEMKAVNEAWRILGNADSRRAYDAGRTARPRAAYVAHTPVSSPSAHADPLSGRIVGAALCLFGGLVLLFLVKAQYVVFLFPLALLALALVAFAILMAHGALSFAREQVRTDHPMRRLVWAQEVFFWLCVVAGGYSVYLMLQAV